MTELRVGGVPEHFNLPFHLAIEDGMFEEKGITVKWVEFPDGTGAMNKALRNNEIDLAIILTGGIIKDIANGNPSKIIQNYVSSPLIWGVHVADKSQFKSIDDLKDAQVAISRYGSGSHVMAHVQAREKEWNTEELKFVEVQTLKNAIETLTTGDADYFMWEHFTTKPVVDSGIFRRVADFPTPWSSFVIAATDTCIAKHTEDLYTFLTVVNTVTADFKSIPSIDRTLANRYEQQLVDIQKWLGLTDWTQEQIKEEEVNYVQKRLLELNMIEDIKPANFYLTKI